MPQFRLVLLIVAVTACATLFSLIAAKVAGWRRFGRFAVPLLLFFAAVYFFARSRWFSDVSGFQDLGYLLLSIVTLISSIATWLLTEVFVHHFRRERARRGQLP
jgi:hypothetical protein